MVKLLERAPNHVVVEHFRPISKFWAPEDGIEVRGPLELIDRIKTTNLRTNRGTDWQKERMSGGGTPPGGTAAALANQIAISGAPQGTGSTLSPAVTDTTLAQELTNAVWNGLGRASGTYTAGTAGSPSYTVAKSGAGAFTLASGGSGTPPVVVYGSGLFDATSGGNLIFEATFTSATLIVGDSLAVTWTINI